MIRYDVRFCDYCHSSILAGERWVREKIYSAQSRNQDPAYRYFHAEPLGGEEESCWEKRQLQREIARAALAQENTSQLQVMRLVA